MTRPRDLVSVFDILSSDELIRSYVAGMELAQFQQDRAKQDAVERRLLIIGEASTRLSPDFRAAHPQVPWDRMIGLRNLVVHRYEEVRLEEIWWIIHQNLPPVIAYLKELMGHPLG